VQLRSRHLHCCCWWGCFWHCRLHLWQRIIIVAPLLPLLVLLLLLLLL
jgi:hypothetical protein